MKLHAHAVSTEATVAGQDAIITTVVFTLANTRISDTVYLGECELKFTSEEKDNLPHFMD